MRFNIGKDLFPVLIPDQHKPVLQNQPFTPFLRLPVHQLPITILCLQLFKEGSE